VCFSKTVQQSTTHVNMFYLTRKTCCIVYFVHSCSYLLFIPVQLQRSCVYMYDMFHTRGQPVK